MKRLPLSIILLLLFLAFFFNLERIGVADEVLINLNTFVYILVTISVVWTIMLSFLRTLSLSWTIVLWLSVYFFLRFFIFNQNPIWGSYDSYITIIEICMMLISITLARWVGWNLQDFENAVENITFSEIKRASQLKDATESIKSEIYRSRRYNHPLTLIMVEPIKGSQDMILNQSVREIQESMISRYVSIALARALHDHIRRTDMLIEMPEKGRFIVLTPETDIRESIRVIEKIKEAAQSIGAEVSVGIAGFPEDALTLEDMLARAELDLGIHEEKKCAELDGG